MKKEIKGLQSREPLTQERLKELLHYDPGAGVFTRIARTSNSIKIGDIAGIYWHQLCNKWCAQTKINEKTKHLGLFIDIKWAIFARWLAEDENNYHVNHGAAI